MRFLHLAIEDGRIVDRQTVDTDELDAALLYETEAELRRLRRDIDTDLAVVAAGDTLQTKAVLEKRLQAGPPAPSSSVRFGVSLGLPGMTIDNPMFADFAETTFWAWSGGQPVLSGTALSTAVDTDLVDVIVYGFLGGTRAGVSVRQGRRRPMHEEIAELQQTTTRILQERPCVMTALIRDDEPRLREDAMRYALHFGVALLAEKHRR